MAVTDSRILVYVTMQTGDKLTLMVKHKEKEIER